MEFFAFSKMAQYTEKRNRLLLFICLAVFFFICEIVAGFKTRSLILFADAFHMLANIAASVATLLSLEITSKKCSQNTFGWARAKILGAFINAVFLIAICFSITIEAIKGCIKQKPMNYPELTAIVGGMGFAVNFIGFCALYEQHGCVTTIHHQHRHHDHQQQQQQHCLMQHSKAWSIRRAFLFLLSDSLGSIIVMISAFPFWNINWINPKLIDPLLTMVLVMFMLYSIFPSLRESALILLQTVPTHIEIETLRKRLLETIDDVLGIHEFHVWRLAGDRIIATAHIRCRNLEDYMKIAEKVKAFFHNEGIHSTTIQPEFIDIENCDLSFNDFCALDCPVTEKGCVQSTCCQFNNKINQLASLGEVPEISFRGDVNAIVAD